MFCPKCGTETPDDSQFCRKCGRSLTVAPTPIAVPPLSPQQVKPKRKLVRAPFLIAGISAIFFLIGYLSTQLTTKNPNASAIDKLTKQEHTLTATSPALVVNPLSFYCYRFDIPQGASGVMMRGDFTASGGLGNDIEVLLLSETDLTNWRNGHAASMLYDSGKVTTGAINVNLPPDPRTYYLVFNNRFSALARKSVRVNAVLTYYQ